jgi:nucleoside-diphosphate-sugar epimerase
MTKKALVTGGSGYFGEVLVSQLLSKGYECTILDLNPPDNSFEKNINFIKVDIRDYKSVLEACKGIEVIFHNVAQVPLAKNKELFRSVNIDGTKNIIKAAKLQGINHLSYTSSSAIYGAPKNNPVTEETCPNPMEDYGKAKLDGEILCKDAINNNLSVSIIRPRTILGGGRLGIFQILFEWIHQNYNVPVFDKGDNLYQFVHSSDLADACIKASEADLSNDYNIGASEFGTMKESLEHLIIDAKKTSKVKSLPSNIIIPFMNIFSALGVSPLGPYHALMFGKTMYFDCSKANKLLGWKPKYSNDEMLFESYENYLKDRLNIINQKVFTKVQ